MNVLAWPIAAGISTVFLLTAALVRRFAPKERPRLRSLALFLCAYLAALGVTAALDAMSWSGSMRIASDVAGFMAWLTIIYICALILFKLSLPRLGYELPSIVGDLAIGAALFVLIVAGLRDLGADPTSLVATSAVVTGILALSLQPTLGNVIGGLALQLDRSVRVGDWLELENGKQGRVREIRWRHTVIETRDWDTIVVPNSSLLAANITILGKREDAPLQHRMWVYFNVDFRFSPTDVIRVAEDALRADPPLRGVASQPPPNCVCLDLASDSRESFGLYAVRYWLTDLANDDPVGSQVRERLFAALRRADIPLAIPAAQLFIEQDDLARREQKHRSHVQQRLAALRAIDLFQVFTPTELEQIADGLRPAPFVQGETITRQGAEAHWLYILGEGDVEVWVNEGKRGKRVASLHAPTFFGEMGLMAGEPRSATVIAASPVLCYKLERADFSRILSERPSVAAEISAILASREMELRSAREDLDARSHHDRTQEASTRLLARIQDFFGLGDSS